MLLTTTAGRLIKSYSIYGPHMEVPEIWAWVPDGALSLRRFFLKGFCQGEQKGKREFWYPGPVGP